MKLALTARWLLSGSIACAVGCAARPTGPLMNGGSEIGQPAPYGHDREPVVFATRDASAHTHSSDVENNSTDASAVAQGEPYAPELREPVRDIAASGEDAVTSDEAIAGSTVELEGGARAMDALYNAIVANQRSVVGVAGGRLAAVQLGDSHTESDEFSGRLRRRWAQQFGSAGRGFVAVAGEQRDVVRTVSGPWTIERAPLRNGTGAYGLGLARAIGTQPSAVLTVGSCARCAQGAVSRFDLYFQREERAGAIEYRVDNGPWQRASTAGASAADRLSVPVAEGAHAISVRPAGDGRVVLYGVAMERDAPGGSLESAGTIGALASHLDNADWTVLSAQLTLRDPSLVLLWFGTNESANSHLDPARFEQALVSIVTKVKRAAPRASVLIIGPPDLALRTASGDRASPAQLARMVSAARSAAQTSGAAFFDLLAAMGGEGTIARWVAREPRLAYGDHVHYTARGYTALADTLFDAIVRGYDRWARAANSAPSSSARGAR